MSPIKRVAAHAGSAHPAAKEAQAGEAAQSNATTKHPTTADADAVDFESLARRAGEQDRHAEGHDIAAQMADAGDSMPLPAQVEPSDLRANTLGMPDTGGAPVQAVVEEAVVVGSTTGTTVAGATATTGLSLGAMAGIGAGAVGVGALAGGGGGSGGNGAGASAGSPAAATPSDVTDTTTPAGNTPAGNTSAGTSPAADTPAADTPAGNTPAVVSGTPTVHLSSASNTGAADDGLTGDATPTLEGTGTAGESIIVSLSTGETLSTTVAEDGTWSVTPEAALADGVVTFTVVEHVAGGTDSAPVSLVVTIDTHATAGTIGEIGGGDGVVNHAEAANLVLNGASAEADAPVSVLISDGNGHSVTVNGATAADGSWAIAAGDLGGLPDGSYAVAATVTDVAGNQAIASSSFVLQAAGPATPHAPDMTDASDTGTSSSDNLTNASMPTFAIAPLQSGESAELFVDGALQATSFDANGSAFIASAPIADGDHYATYWVHDAAGNTSAPSSSSNFTIDTRTSAGAIGAIATDGIVDHNEAPGFALTGSGAEAGAAISVLISNGQGGDLTASATADGSGQWSTGPLDMSAQTDGAYDVTATATDAAGNRATATTTFTLANVANTIDTVAGDGVVNSFEVSSVSVSGFGVEAGDAVSVVLSDSQGTTHTNSAIVQADGSWSADLFDVSDIVDGAGTVVATFTDAQNQTTTATTHFLIDTQVASGLILPVGGIDEVVNGAEAAHTTVSGTEVEPGSFIDLQLTDGQGHTDFASVIADVNGNWAASDLDLSGLSDGQISVAAYVEDPAGNSDDPAMATFTLDQHAIAGYVWVGTGSGLVSAAEVADTSVSGSSADPGSAISALLTDSQGAQQTVTATADQNGDWTVDHVVLSGMAEGQGTAQITVTDPAGNQTTADPENFTIDTQVAPGAISSVGGNNVVNHDEVDGAAMAGAGADAFASVDVLITDSQGNEQHRFASTTGNGDWSISATDLSAMAEGAATAIATVTDEAGNVASSDPLGFTIDTIVAAGTIDALTGDDLVNSSEAGHLSISGSGVEAGSTVSVEVIVGTNNNPSFAATVDGNGAWLVADADLSGLADSQYTLVARVSDSAGNHDIAFDSFRLDTHAVTGTMNNIAGEGIVNATERNGFDLTGQGAEVAADVSVLLSDGNGHDRTVTGTVAGDGTWSIASGTLAAFPDGDYSATATFTDSAGNTASVSHDFAIDTSGPASPAAPVMRASDDTGISSSDAITTNTQPQFELDASVTGSDEVQLFVDGLQVGANRDGVHNTLAPIDPLPEGTLAVTYLVIDAQGNSAESAPLPVTIDSTFPTQTVAITRLIDDAGRVTGSFSDGVVTDDTAPVLHGTLSAALGVEHLMVSRDGNVLGAATVNGTDWTFADSGLASGQSYDYTVQVSADAGSTGTPSSTFHVAVVAAGGAGESGGNSGSDFDGPASGQDMNDLIFISGGAGHDILHYENAAAEVALNSLMNGESGYGTGNMGHVISGIEEVIGSAYDDVLNSNDSSPVVLRGGAGDDGIVGGDSDDTLVGGKGSDTFSGSTGHDTFVFAMDALSADAAVNGDADRINDFTSDGVHDDAITLTGVLSSEFSGQTLVLHTVDGQVDLTASLTENGSTLALTLDDVAHGSQSTISLVGRGDLYGADSLTTITALLDTLLLQTVSPV